MKLLLKLMVLAIAVALLLPVLRPDAPVSSVVSAAIEDVGNFCDRNPAACDEGQQIAVRAGDLISRALRSLAEDERSHQPLTAQDRTLAPAPALSAHNADRSASSAPQPNRQ